MSAATTVGNLRCEEVGGGESIVGRTADALRRLTPLAYFEAKNRSRTTEYQCPAISSALPASESVISSIVLVLLMFDLGRRAPIWGRPESISRSGPLPRVVGTPRQLGARARPLRIPEGEWPFKKDMLV